MGIDIGASSGRHIIGYIENDELITEEIYRFKNAIKEEKEHLIWDVEYLFKEVKNGIKKALNKCKNIKSLSVDTWGVDYVLLNENEVIEPCYAYRDQRTLKIIIDLIYH